MTSGKPSAAAARGIGARLLAWYDRHGRKTLPWKAGRKAYRIWVSEVMLQQTQVATVVPYYLAFMRRFPDVRALARAPLDTVLRHWTGLGYYARARNLHRAARILVQEHGARFPRTIDAVERLPGIGRSTAGAILALAFDARHAILDGNVKRVLARYHAIGEPVNQRQTDMRLWQLAERHTPHTRVGDYTQAIMDLGATVCRRSQPACADCPLRRGCKARALGRVTDFPVTTRAKKGRLRHVNWLVLRDAQGRILLQRRPPAGIWGGLWSFPETDARDIAAWSRTQLGFDIETAPALAPLRHSFSHFDLLITPIPARLLRVRDAMENADAVWYNLRNPVTGGTSAPVKRLLEQLRAVGAAI